IADAWRLGHPGRRALAIEVDAARIDVSAWGSSGEYRVETGEAQWLVQGARHEGEWLTWRDGQGSHRLRVRASGEDWLVFVDERRYRIHEAAPYAWTASEGSGSDRVLAPMPGRIVAL